LQLVSQGLSDYQAAKALGIHISTVSQWKRRDEQFLERYIRARAQAELQREVSGGEG
jgi:transposase